MNMPTMVTIKEASIQSGVSYDFIRKLCLQNKIVFVKAGKKYLINLEKFIAFLNGETEEGEENG